MKLSKRQLSDRVNFYLNGSVKLLSKDEVGLVSVDSTEISSPFTTQQYEDAYNNGIKLEQAIASAYAAGYSGIQLERGIYPLAPNRGLSGSGSGFDGLCMAIHGINNFDFNFNGSTFFTLYDSVNRSPYDNSTDDVHTMGFSMMAFISCKNIKVFNLELRGDNYMRSWVAGEDLDIGCYGLLIKSGCSNVKIDRYEGHGFRCESLAVSNFGNNYNGVGDWVAGEIDVNGDLVAKTGAYSTELLDISSWDNPNKNIVLIGAGYTREIRFRESIIQIAYYDEFGDFISAESSIQNKLNHLPDNCTQVRFTAYGDERTDLTVDYGTIWAQSDTPRDLEVVGSKFYNNMRGGIAGTANNTVIHHCVFHTIGDAIFDKFGWSVYTSSTKFAIDIEDGLPDFVMVDHNRFEDVIHAVLAPSCQTFHYTNNLSQGNSIVSFTGNCKYAKIEGNVFKGDGLLATLTHDTGEHTCVVSNNEFIDGEVIVSAMNNERNSAIVNGNKYINTKVELEGNVISGKDNYHCYNSRSYTSVLRVNCISFDDQIIEKDGETSWYNANFSTTNGKSSSIITLKSNRMGCAALNASVPSMRFEGDTDIRSIGRQMSTSEDLTQTFTGTEFERISLSLGSGSEVETLFGFKSIFTNVTFKDSMIAVFRKTSVDSGATEFIFDGCDIYLTDVSTFIENAYESTSGSLTFNFIDCRFMSDTDKSVDLLGGASTAINNLNITLVNCETHNVNLNVIGDPAIKFRLPDRNCPTYASNALALAAIGEGYYYKDSSNGGKFEITY